MASIQFNVPENVKRAFEDQFEAEDRDAVAVDWLQRAIDEARRKEKRARAMDALMQRKPERTALDEPGARRILDSMRGRT